MHDPPDSRDLAAFPRCSVCEQLEAEDRSPARWPLSVPALLDDSRWQSDSVPGSGGLARADSPCSGRTDSIYDSAPDLWKWDLDVAGDCCPRVPGPAPQPAVPFLYTHSVSHAHCLCTFSLRDVQTRTRMAQGVCSVCVCVISLHLALSILMFHPPSLLFPHGHFDAKFPSAPSSSSVTRPRSVGQAHFRTCAGEFRYLADPTHLTSYEPKEFLTRRPLTIRTTIASLTSRKPHARTLDCLVLPQCLKPLFRTFLMVILPEMQKGFF